MKKLLFALILMSGSCLSQSIDSTSIRVERLEKAVDFMADQFQQSGRDYTAGIVLGVLGAGVTTAGVFIKSSSQQKYLLIGGGALSIFGFAFLVSSHADIARAGKWHFNGSKLVLDF